MSGGPIGVAYIIGSAFIACGEIAAGTAAIAVQGGVAAYEQLVIANECTREIEKLNLQIKDNLRYYETECCNIVMNIAQLENNEITKLQRALQQMGVPASMVNVRGTTEQKLIKLIELYNERNSVNGNCISAFSSVRTPKQLYDSVYRMAIPIVAALPDNAAVRKSLVNIIDNAKVIAMDNNMSIDAKLVKLKDIESNIINSMDKYKSAVQTTEILRQEYIGYSVALRKLAEVVGESVSIEEFNLAIAEQQLASLKVRCEQMREQAKNYIRNDANAIRANEEMAKLIVESIEECGNVAISVENKPYGMESYHKFGNSMLQAVTTKDGVVGLNIVGKNGESDEEVFRDEAHFCRTQMQRIINKMKDNGVMFDLTSRQFLTPETICRIDIPEGNLINKQENFNQARRKPIERFVE